MSNLGEVEVYPHDDSETIDVKKYYIETYWRPSRKEMFDNTENARDYVNKQIQKNPFNTDPYFIVEVKEVIRSKPVAETQIESIEVQGYIQERLESKEDV